MKEDKLLKYTTQPLYLVEKKKQSHIQYILRKDNANSNQEGISDCPGFRWGRGDSNRQHEGVFWGSTAVLYPDCG